MATMLVFSFSVDLFGLFRAVALQEHEVLVVVVDVVVVVDLVVVVLLHHLFPQEWLVYLLVSPGQRQAHRLTGCLLQLQLLLLQPVLLLKLKKKLQNKFQLIIVRILKHNMK